MTAPLESLPISETVKHQQDLGRPGSRHGSCRRLARRGRKVLLGESPQELPAPDTAAGAAGGGQWRWKELVEEPSQVLSAAAAAVGGGPVSGTP